MDTLRSFAMKYITYTSRRLVFLHRSPYCRARVRLHPELARRGGERWDHAPTPASPILKRAPPLRCAHCWIPPVGEDRGSRSSAAGSFPGLESVPWGKDSNFALLPPRDFVPQLEVPRPVQLSPGGRARLPRVLRLNDPAAASLEAENLAASGNDSGALTAQGGGEGEPHSQSPDILLGNADKERNARAAASPSRARPALVAPCQPEPRTLAMEPGCPGGLLLPRPCRVLVLLNPGAGKGKALQLFQNHVQPLLEEAEISFKLMVTERQNHAKELVYAEELGHWDALVIMSGDGLIHEVVNGLMERPDWEIAIQKPLCSLPGGSGNAVAASINYYAGYEQVTSEDLLFNCTLLLCRRRLSPMNLLSLHTASGRHLYSVLSLAWGFIADVDLESEKYRRLGEFRFMLGTFCHLVSLRIYQGQLAYLPVGKAASKVPASPALAQEGPVDTHLVPLEEPVPSHWTVVPEQDFVLVLVLLHSHLTRELFAAPTCCREAGIMHLFYIRAGVSRIMLLRLFLAMQKGKHMELDCPYVVHVPVVAFRLEPKNQRGLFAVDGERMACEAVQGQVHPNYFWMVCDSRDGPSSWEPQQRPPPEP